MAKLHPAFLARAKAVGAAHKYLAATHPNWATLSPTDRFKAVHAHVDRQKAGLAGQVTALRGAGVFRPAHGTPPKAGGAG